MKPGSGDFVVNDRTLDEYLRARHQQDDPQQPLDGRRAARQVGHRGQRLAAAASRGKPVPIRHGISRALTKLNPEFGRR